MPAQSDDSDAKLIQHAIAPTTEAGSLGVCHLKRLWSISCAKRAGQIPGAAYAEEWAADTALLDLLGVGIEQFYQQLHLQQLDFAALEAWILALNLGVLPAARVQRFNALIRGESPASTGPIEPVLGQTQLDFWHEHGYVVVPNAAPAAQILATHDMVWQALGKSPADPQSWYQYHPLQQGIMVQLFQHPLLDANRNAARVQGAFAQLWQRSDLWANTDRVGFNPPETPTRPFQGPRLHWDVSLKTPIPFGLQGILYLSDTAENQGAFTLVPGMHRALETWLGGLPTGANPRQQDLYALGAVAIAGKAGDLIIWHQALAHGASPNTAKLPRIVQYLTWQPFDRVIADEWL